MLHAHADSMVDELISLAKDFRPDVVVYDPTALAGALAAAAIGVPAVRQLYGADLMLRARSVLPELLAPLAARNASPSSTRTARSPSTRRRLGCDCPPTVRRPACVTCLTTAVARHVDWAGRTGRGSW